MRLAGTWTRGQGNITGNARQSPQVFADFVCGGRNDAVKRCVEPLFRRKRIADANASYHLSVVQILSPEHVRSRFRGA